MPNEKFFIAIKRPGGENWEREEEIFDADSARQWVFEEISLLLGQAWDDGLSYSLENQQHVKSYRVSLNQEVYTYRLEEASRQDVLDYLKATGTPEYADDILVGPLKVRHPLLEETERWFVEKDLRELLEGITDNVSAEELIKRSLAAKDFDLISRVTFNSDVELFKYSAYSEEDALQLARLVLEAAREHLQKEAMRQVNERLASLGLHPEG